jgi:membrane-bound lytic murein transglycosylase D
MRATTLWALAGAVLLSGCQMQQVFRREVAPAPNPEVNVPASDATVPSKQSAPSQQSTSTERAAVATGKSATKVVKSAEPIAVISQWQQIVQARRFTDCSYDPNIENWARRLTASPPSFNASVERIQPYIDYVWRRTQAQGMPSEIAFLPLVESDYRQVYGSYGSPGGWWQLMPDVAKMYGLSVSRDNDERLDPVKATEVALKLTRANADRFKEDWLLTIFAYNVGGQRLANSLRERGLEPGRIEHVNQIGLPLTTEDHLHRLIAWGCVLANPQKYRVTLPPDLPEHERFADVRITQTTPLDAVTASLGRFATHWAGQHPIVERRGEIRYGQHVLAPAGVNKTIAALGDLKRFKRNPVLAATPPIARASSVATRSTATRASSASKKQTTSVAVNVPASYKVKNGDNLWLIARRFDMRVKEILALNPGLSRDTVLKLGQKLRMK